MRSFRVVTLALLSALTFMATPASAIPVTYQFDLTTNGNPVTDLVIYSAGLGTDNVFFAPDTLAPSGVQTLSHSVPFDPTSTLIVGLNAGVGDDGAHIIMFTNTEFAANAVGHRWNEFFSSPRHSVFIDLLDSAHDGNAISIAAVTDFFHGSQAAGASFDPSGAFSILQFSVVAPPIGGSVPEPGTVGLLASALAIVLGYRLRRPSPSRC